MIYAISDLHGYPIGQVKALFDKADFSDRDFCFVLGDVIDRGKDGIKLLKWMMPQTNIQFILGNHEMMMLACDFLFDEVTEENISRLTGTKLELYHHWMYNGAQPTLEALRAERPESVEYILDFLRDAPLYDAVTAGGRDFILTHSGLGNFAKDKHLPDYTPDELVWTRPELSTRYFDDIITVFGHTPTVFLDESCARRAIFTDTWINIDAGCACGYAPMMLRLDDLHPIYLDI